MVWWTLTLWFVYQGACWERRYNIQKHKQIIGRGYLWTRRAWALAAGGSRGWGRASRMYFSASGECNDMKMSNELSCNLWWNLGTLYRYICMNVCMLQYYNFWYLFLICYYTFIVYDALLYINNDVCGLWHLNSHYSIKYPCDAAAR